MERGEKSGLICVFFCLCEVGQKERQTDARDEKSRGGKISMDISM